MTANVYHFHLYGSRESKFAWLNENDLSSTDFAKLEPQSPFHLFIPQNTDFLEEYLQFRKITDIMPVSSVGIVTGQDSKTIGFTLNETQELARFHNLSKDIIQPTLCHPFDMRFIVYDRKVVTRGRQEIMRHIMPENMFLIYTRNTSSGKPFEHVFCTKYSMIGRFYPDASCVAYFSPLYVYPKSDEMLEEKRRVNFSEEFLSEAKQKLGKLTPEEMLSYIYAVFHSPTYRSRYAEFLKMDFPRLPLTSNRKVFESLSELGKELIALHLLEKSLNVKTKFPIVGTNEVGTVKYDSGKVWINKTQYIHIVDENIWKFHIGGYQVCQKWLRDRKGRKLGFDELIHYGKMISAIEETIRIMAEIDRIQEDNHA